MDSHTEDLLAEAADRNRGLEALAVEGLATFAGANMFVKMFLRDMIQRGVGMTLESLGTEIRAASDLIERLRSGGETLEDAKPALEAYAGLVRRTISFVESLESMAGRIKDPARRGAVVAMTRSRVEDARRLADVLDELVMGS